MATSIEVPDKVMQTAKQIVKSLKNSSDKETNDMLLILSSFDNRLSNITQQFISEPQPDSPSFSAAEELILHHDSNLHSPSYDPDEYLSAVDQILLSIDHFSFGSDPEFSDRAENALQMSMTRLEDEFRHTLITNTEAFDSDRLYGSIRRVSLSLALNDGAINEDFESFAEDDDVSGSNYWHDRGRSLGDDVSVDLVKPEAVILLKDIADRMIRSKYEKECCQVYSNVRRDVIDEYMSNLDVEKLSIDEVQKIEWQALDEKMKKWVQAVKIVVRILLWGEKRLCEQIFSGSELIQEVCFVETAKGCVMQLLNFGEAVAIGNRSSQKLFRILDMYDVLVDVYPDLQELFKDDESDSGELVCSEAKGVIDSLGETAIGTFVEFEKDVQGEQSRKPIQGGEIHPLTRYVMNYLKLLVDYSDTLNSLLKVGEGDTSHRGQNDDLELESRTPIAQRLLSLITTLESNLEEKSRMYEDGVMQYIFLMNNILYIVQKVKDSELRNVLGDDWIRKRSGQVRQYATGYLRASWTRPLACLKDDGIGGSTGNASKVALKERFKNFNAYFEDIYRVQTSWKVPDAQLREELRIIISDRVLPAYRSFVGRFGSHLESGRNAGKYVKYTPEDLENYLLDLFEGTPLILHHMRRKGA